MQAEPTPKQQQAQSGWRAFNGWSTINLNTAVSWPSNALQLRGKPPIVAGWPIKPAGGAGNSQPY